MLLLLSVTIKKSVIGAFSIVAAIVMVMVVHRIPVGFAFCVGLAVFVYRVAVVSVAAVNFVIVVLLLLLLLSSVPLSSSSFLFLWSLLSVL